MGKNVFYRSRSVWRHVFPYAVCAACLVASFYLSTCSKQSPAFAEAVAHRVYRPVSNALARITGVLPFSLLEFGLIAAAIVFVILVVIFIQKWRKSKGNRAALTWRWGSWLLCVLCVGLLVFTMLCGVNYYRRPFSFYSGLTLQPSSTNELEALCLRLSQEANRLRVTLPEDENGTVRVFTQGYKPTAQQARTAMEGLAAQYPVLAGYYPLPKRVACSTAMSYMNITGVYSPFTMEANVNTDCPAYSIPATMCHELSHLRGFMREDEANFIAYLACAGSGDAAFQYSAVTLALVHAGNQLYRADQQRYAALLDTYCAGLRRDMEANNAYWRQFEHSRISTVSTRVNDAYLKANAQLDGVQSYGRMVDLLLALYRTTGDLGLLQKFDT